MADGEKKRFGNFAEYAKARQAGKLPVPGDFSQGLSGEDRQGIDLYHFQDQQVPGMQGPGNSDQSRFMQSFSSSQTGQPPMSMLGGSSGLPMQQSIQQQRGMGVPGSSHMGMNINRAPLGMSLGIQGGGNSANMSTLGLGRAPASQQGSVQGIMGQQRINPMQGGGMGPLNMSRSNTIGLQQGAGGQPGYGPSDAGDILAMLNKGNLVSNGAAQGQGGLPPGLSRSNSGLQQLAPGGQGPVGTGAVPDGGIVGITSQTEFSMEEDFPALPGASSGQGPNNSLMSGSGNHGLVEQFQRMKMEGGGGASDASETGSQGHGGQPSHEKPDRYGMLGLLSVIRMVDENLNTLALGTDLTHLGLNLNASDNLYETFTSPWADTRASRAPEYTLPRCYYISPPALKTVFFQKFCDMTLFYIFYHFLTRPSDAPHQELRGSLVKYAYQELVSRGWQYQQDGNLWLKRAEGSNQVMFFDLNLMEARPFIPGSSAPSSGTSTPPSSIADGH